MCILMDKRSILRGTLESRDKPRLMFRVEEKRELFPRNWFNNRVNCRD